MIRYAPDFLPIEGDARLLTTSSWCGVSQSDENLVVCFAWHPLRRFEWKNFLKSSANYTLAPSINIRWQYAMINLGRERHGHGIWCSCKAQFPKGLGIAITPERVVECSENSSNTLQMIQSCVKTEYVWAYVPCSWRSFFNCPPLSCERWMRLCSHS